MSLTERSQHFFAGIAKTIQTPPTAVIVVTHFLPDRPVFIEALSKIAHVAALIPKPKSINSNVLGELSSSFNVVRLDRTSLSNPTVAIDMINACVTEHDFAILDMGGYFAPTLNALRTAFGHQLVGVVEDTENGHQRYEKLPVLPCPIISIARSPLKYSEDYLVGGSIVEVSASVMRQVDESLIGRRALVIGYGKVGRSIAMHLAARRIPTSVVDTNPIRCTQALSEGFLTPTRDRALSSSEVIYCATGNHSIGAADFPLLKNGAFVFSATSADDEFSFDESMAGYQAKQMSPFLSTLTCDEHYFFLGNNGDAINFVDGGSIGAFIRLSQGELIAALGIVNDLRDSKQIHELNEKSQELLATVWLDHFTNEQDGATLYPPERFSV